ncbi:MAG TPA: hypothetical protein VE464_23660 [Streptosporangiaceae bacterium]|nr:hypothetical protein [Streptosporangiaceae bacterium]
MARQPRGRTRAPPVPSAQPLRPRLEDGYLTLIRRRGAGPQ